MSAVSLSLSGRPGRLLRWAFLVSLALNLFFIGVSATHLVRNRLDPAGHFKPGLRLDAMVDTLPSADGAVLRAALDTDMAKVTAVHAAYRKAQDAARQALAAQPFDQVAFEAALADIRAKRQDLQKVLHAIVLQAAGGMSAEGRRRLGEWTAIKGAS